MTCFTVLHFISRKKSILLTKDWETINQHSNQQQFETITGVTAVSSIIPLNIKSISNVNLAQYKKKIPGLIPSEICTELEYFCKIYNLSYS